MVFSLNFLDPSSLRLASGSLGPLNHFSLKEPARLGEPVTTGVSLGSPRRAAMVPSALFSINRHKRELRGRFQGPEGEEIERRDKEEKMRPRGYRIATAIIPYFVSCSAFFVRPSISFVFKI